MLVEPAAVQCAVWSSVTEGCGGLQVRPHGGSEWSFVTAKPGWTPMDLANRICSDLGCALNTPLQWAL